MLVNILNRLRIEEIVFLLVLVYINLKKKNVRHKFNFLNFFKVMICEISKIKRL